ncbi:MAG: hypothetical protein KJO31_03125 [Gammaproteobacteria bacterium]|nr:hypothetical protein [Gammaproteobacteria bacterium]
MRKLLKACLLVACVQGITLSSLASAQYAPAIDFESIMNGYFDDESGLINFTDYRVAFAPEAPFNGLVAVLDAEGTIVGQHKFFPDYANREGVFAVIRAVGPADVTLTTPGLYTIVFVVNNQPVTRFAVRLEETGSGDDPFDPVKKYGFDGYWRTMAHLTMKTWKDEQVPEITMWAGSKDLPAGKRQDMFVARLLRDGEMVAHSRETTGHIAQGHFEPKYVSMYHPHTRRQIPNAELFMLKDWQVDGAYEIEVIRQSDGKKIRSYDFDVVDGEIQSIPQSQLGYESATDFVLPRVLRKGGTALEMIEAIWIQDIKR